MTRPAMTRPVTPRLVMRPDVWPIGTPVWVSWGIGGWRPAVVLSYTTRQVRLRLLDTGAPCRAAPQTLRTRTPTALTARSGPHTPPEAHAMTVTLEQMCQRLQTAVGQRDTDPHETFRRLNRAGWTLAELIGAYAALPGSTAAVAAILTPTPEPTGLVTPGPVLVPA
jgi:hypothetical protein